MLRLLRLLALVVGGAIAGFALALYFQWTFSLNRSDTRSHFEYRLAPDGSLMRLPTLIEESSLIITSQPYKPAETFDLFEEDTP